MENVNFFERVGNGLKNGFNKSVDFVKESKPAKYVAIALGVTGVATIAFVAGRRVERKKNTKVMSELVDEVKEAIGKISVDRNQNVEAPKKEDKPEGTNEK